MKPKVSDWRDNIIKPKGRKKMYFFNLGELTL